MGNVNERNVEMHNTLSFLWIYCRKDQFVFMRFWAWCGVTLHMLTWSDWHEYSVLNSKCVHNIGSDNVCELYVCATSYASLKKWLKEIKPTVSSVESEFPPYYSPTCKDHGFTAYLFDEWCNQSCCIWF